MQGPGLAKPLTIRSAGQDELFESLMSQISWMAGRSGDPMGLPKASALGPRYTVTVYTGTVAISRYDLYPNATGGPRAYRPAAQPRGATTAAWFYAPVSMADTLRAVGVPLPELGSSAKSGTLVGDPIGFQNQPTVAHTTASSGTMSQVLDQERRAVLMSAAAACCVLLLVFLAAGRSRRNGR